MTPEERQLLSGLFDRIRGAANTPRDRDAETFITDSIRTQPYAPYLMAQTVIVQEQALRAANERLQQLEAQVRDQQAGSQGGDTSFLGGIGKSLFGSSGQGQQPGRSATPNSGGYSPAPVPGQQGQGGPWGNQGQQAAGGGGFMGGGAPDQGGGFLKGALGAAAGVAGGVLLADSIRGLFGGGHNPFGIASGFGGGAGGGFGGGGETIVNNYYEGGDQGFNSVDTGYDGGGQGFTQDVSDDFGGDGFDSGGGGDDSYNV